MAKKNQPVKPSERLEVGDMGTQTVEDLRWPTARISEMAYGKVPGAVRTTSIFLVLDRSGSMEVVRDATIEGINAFVSRAASSDERAQLTLATFSTDYSLMVSGIDLREFRPIGKRDYRPSGGTALLDAFAQTIAVADAQVIRGEVAPGDVLFVVMTDGEENSSRHYTRQAIAALVADRETAGYEFLYLGANQDSFDEAGSIGVSHSGDWQNDEYGTRLNMERARRITSEKMAGRRVDCLLDAEIQPSAADAEWVADAIKGRKSGK